MREAFKFSMFVIFSYSFYCFSTEISKEIGATNHMTILFQMMFIYLQFSLAKMVTPENKIDKTGKVIAFFNTKQEIIGIFKIETAPFKIRNYMPSEVSILTFDEGSKPRKGGKLKFDLDSIRDKN